MSHLGDCVSVAATCLYNPIPRDFRVNGEGRANDRSPCWEQFSSGYSKGDSAVAVTGKSTHGSSPSRTGLAITHGYENPSVQIESGKGRAGSRWQDRDR